MSTITLRPREPLASLPLSRYTTGHGPLPPSPVSLPNKRPLTSSPGRSGGSPSTSTSSKHRKVSNEGLNGQETIKRKRSEITPRAKRALAEDEFGMGKSPARRLFVDDDTSYGISGAVLPSPSGGPSRTLDFQHSTSNMAGPSRTLAPSPPISSAPSPVQLENGVEISVHDIGFTIHPDAPHTARATAGRSYLGTPDSRPQQSNSHRLATSSTLASPSRLPDNDQENQPPPTPSSQRTTPSKSSLSITSSSSSARFYDDNDIVNLTGSGRKRVRERSKLNEVVKRASMGHDDLHADAEEQDQELTPGRTTVEKGKGKQKMASEVDEH